MKSLTEYYGDDSKLPLIVIGLSKSSVCLRSFFKIVFSLYKKYVQIFSYLQTLIYGPDPGGKYSKAQTKVTFGNLRSF